jgi:two-component system sensor kinase FixL
MFTGFLRDLTERQQTQHRLQELQAELTHVSRLTEMGQMASTLAHEVNQPLITRVSNDRLATAIDAARLAPALRPIGEAGEVAAHLIGRSANRALEPTGVVLRGTESFLTHRWREADSNHQSREAGDRRLGRMICCSR